MQAPRSPESGQEPQEPSEDDTCESALQSEVLGDEYYAGHGHWPFASAGDD